jgi:hypothetical protein
MEDVTISEVLMIKLIWFGLVGTPYAKKVARTGVNGGKRER